MRALAAFVMVALAGGSPESIRQADRSDVTGTRVVATVLGAVQDGGLPHLGCDRECCMVARRDPALRQRVASLALTVQEPGPKRRVFLIDATPDFVSQVDSLLGPEPGRDRPVGLPVDGILLTHAHIGHYLGLAYLGRESMAARGVPVHATRRMSAFLSTNGPWKRLVEGGHVDLRVLEPGRPVELAPGLTATALRVAHREEESDAVGFLVVGPSRRLLYLPDIDAWERWDRDIADVVGGVDVSLLDGTFHSAADLPGRPISEVPHPFVTDTMDRLQSRVKEGRRVIFIHLNHSNPVLAPGSPEREAAERRGFEIASDGLEIPL